MNVKKQSGLKLRLKKVTALGAFTLLATCMRAASTPPGDVPVYPVKVSTNGRYLVDKNNKPFLIVGDSPQGLISRLTEKEVDAFFANRQAKGFNTMGWVDVLCSGRDFIKNTYATTPDGIRPFTGFVAGGMDHEHYDLSKPNEAFFVRLDHIVEMGAKYHLLMFIDPIETAGWLKTLRNNGPAIDYAYGQYLGSRYRKYTNIIWISGNDFGGWRNESDDALVRAVAKGIKAKDPEHLQTVEFDIPTRASLDDPSWASIIALNGAYIYGPTYLQMLRNYHHKPVMPAFLMEAHYDWEDVGTPPDFGTPSVLRREEYWTMLSGGKGQFYGNLYTWSFKDGWQTHIDTPGVAQLTIWKNFFAALPWHVLEPDETHAVLTAGFGSPGDMNTRVSKSDYATAAKTPDGTQVVVYMPTRRTVTLNMAAFPAPASARWFDPTNGAYTDVQGSPIANKGTSQFTPPEKNHDGEGDWVLLLSAAN